MRGGPQPEAYDSDFARADGFDSFSDMVEFFEKQYGFAVPWPANRVETLSRSHSFGKGLCPRLRVAHLPSVAGR